MNQIRQKKIKLVFYRTLFSQSGASLTMGSIASLLRKNGYKVDLCFLEKRDLHATEKILKDRERYNIIIAKPNFKDYKELFNILAGLKKYKKINKIFICGPYASLNAEELIKDYVWIDGVITGAIEETSLALVNSLNKDCSNFDTNCPRGIWRKPSTNQISSNKIRNATISLNKLPFPARDIEAQENVKYINIEASRGCAFGCSFCHNPIMAKFNNKKGVVDMKNPKLVVDEMEYLHKKLNKTLFIFNDDCFWRGPMDNDRIEKFCSEIKKRKLNIKFYIYLRCKPFISEKLLKKLSSVGLARVFLGLENASKRSQAVFNKTIEKNIYSQIKKRLEARHINIHIGYIVFEPYSTIDDIILNFDYLLKIRKLFRLGVILEPMRVIPSSKLHIKLQSDNLISKNTKCDKITYGYNFLNTDVGKLLKKLKKIFSETLNPEAYEYEYYCTTCKLLETLLKKEKNKYKKIIRDDFKEFNQMRDISMNLLSEYLKNTARLTARGDLRELNQEDKSFIDKFRTISQSIKIKHADIITKTIEGGGRDIVKEIYIGIDRI